MVLKDTNIGRLILGHVSQEKTAEEKTDKDINISDVKRISCGLAKVASLPYKEEVYGSVQEIMKIASECIKDLTESFESVQSRNSDLEKVSETRVLIDEMVNMGDIDEHSVEEKVAELMGKTPQQLEVVKEAMKLVRDRKEGNVFDETEKTASSYSEKKGMFDSVIE